MDAATLDPLVPTLSLRAEPTALARDLGGSLERFGFAIVADHGVDAGVIARADAAARAFFARPLAEKLAAHRAGTGGARGYTPFGVETAKGARAADLKEFFHVGRDLPAGHRFAATMPANVWPADAPAFVTAARDLFAALDAAARRLLGAVARHLGIAPDRLDDAVADGNSVLRLLHYPPLGAEAAGLRAAAHEDINVLTLLLGAEEAGLQLLDRDGTWRDVRPPAGALVVNVGDMLQRLTNGVLRSTTHRVANPTGAGGGRSRHSMPFFLHFRPDFAIRPLPSCVSAARPARWPEPITANDYLAERLREIRLA